MTKPTTERPMTFEDVKRIFADEANQYLTSMSEEDIRDYVRQALSSARDTIMLRTLGFTNSFNRWEVDHCNNRMSALRDLVAKTALQEFESWFASEMKKPLEMNAEQKKAVRREFDEALRSGVRTEARRRAEASVKEYVDEALGGTVGPIISDEFLDRLDGK